MRICIVTPFFNAQYKSVRFDELSKRFVKKGHEVHIITRGKKFKLKCIDGRFVHYLPVNSIAMKLVPSLSYHVREYLRMVCREYDVDIIEAHHLSAFGITRVYLGVPIVAQIAQLYSETLKALRSFKFSELPLRYIVNRLFYVPNILMRMDMAICASSDMIITSCNHAKRIMVSLGIPESKIKVVSGGVDTKVFKPNIEQETKNSLTPRFCREASHIILSVARISILKGFEFLIRSLKLLKSKWPRLKCIIIGGGSIDEVSRLRKLAYRLGIQDSVMMMGFVRHEKMPYVYSIADIVVLPSLREGTPLVLLEAMACCLLYTSPSPRDRG